MPNRHPEDDLTLGQVRLVRRLGPEFQNGFLFTCPANDESPEMDGMTHIVFSDPGSLIYLYESLRVYVEPMLREYEATKRASRN